MVKIMPNRRTGEMTQVHWIEYDDEGKKHSRSKQLDTPEQALIFKKLVEDNAEQLPTYVALAEHGLMKFGYTINPEFILNLREIASRTDLDAERKIGIIKYALLDF